MGLAAEALQDNRRQKLCATVLTLFAGFMFYRLGLVITNLPAEVLVYHWVNLKVIKINMNLTINPDNLNFIISGLLVAGSVLFYNVFYDMEKTRLRNLGLYLFIIVAMFFLVAAENMMQILIAAALIDILSFYLIHDITAKHKYVFYNFLADTALVVVCALIWGKVGKLNLNAFEVYAKIGNHKDLAAILLLFAVFAKSGLFLFHNSIFDLQKINFLKAMFISRVATPLAGVIILFKVYAVLKYNEYVIPVMQIIAALSIIWAMFGALIIDNILAKILYMNMALYGLLYGLLTIGKPEMLELLPLITGVGLLNAFILIIPVIAAANEKYIIEMGGFYKILKISLIITLLTIGAEITLLLPKINNENIWWMGGFMGGQLLVMSQLLPQIYGGKQKIAERVWAEIKTPYIFYVLPVGLVAVAFSFDGFYFNYWSLPIMLGFLAMMLLPVKFWDKIYANENIQENEPLIVIYKNLLIAPIKVLGRVLWLLVDFILIERTIIDALNRLTMFLIRIFKFIHQDMRISGIIFTTLGGLVAVMFYYWGVEK